MRFILLALSVATVLMGCNQQEPATTSESKDAWAYDSYPNRFPEFPFGNGIPGPFGEPPRAVAELKEPIQLVMSGMYLDGGTTFAHLRDVDGHEAIICLSQSALESEFPPKTLFVGSHHPSSQSARLPLTDEEAFMLCRSLQHALGPLEAKRETINQSEEAPSDADRQVLIAFQMLSKLSTIQNFSLADAKQLEEQILELTNVDIKSLSATFRNSEGQDRHAAWQKIKPVLIGKINSDPKINRSEFVKTILGEPAADGEGLFPGKTVYALSTVNNSTVYLVIEMNNISKLDCNEVRVTTPN